MNQGVRRRRPRIGRGGEKRESHQSSHPLAAFSSFSLFMGEAGDENGGFSGYRNSPHGLRQKKIFKDFLRVHAESYVAIWQFERSAQVWAIPLRLI